MDESQIRALIAGILHEYRDELTKEASDTCDECGPAVMCRFHSLLSLLAGHTSLLSAPPRPAEGHLPDREERLTNGHAEGESFPSGKGEEGR